MKYKTFTPFVSVLVPVYNVSKYLRQCLDSLINQTLREIEIICVNDGSTDDSPAILAEYAAMDDRVRIINKANGGLPSARNAGLEVARGSYVGFVDGDDYVDARMFDRMYAEAKLRDADIVVCGAHCFPNEDEAPKWLRDTLSPRDTFYKNASADVLFEERGARPFVWRDLVRRSLIEAHGFRLDPTIVVGEDQAFQFKIFPVAEKVSFISDKLYYYRWSRPDSLMNESGYRDYGTRIYKHVRMIESIGRNWNVLGLMKQNYKKFFDWCVDFFYWDIIRVTACDRTKIAEDFCKVVTSLGYYSDPAKLAPYTHWHYEYIRSLVGKSYAQPRVSIVAVVGNCKDYIRDCLESVVGQSMEDIEILLYDNAADKESHQIVTEYLYKDPRISLRMSDWEPVATHYNDALMSAKGDYVFFINPYDHMESRNFIRDISAQLDENKDVGLIGHIKKTAPGVYDIVNCQNADYHHFMFRMSEIRKNKLRFNDYSMMTGRVFFTKYCLNSKKVMATDSFVYRNKPLKRNKIYADEARLILKAFIWMLKAGKENGLNELRREITKDLNSENYERLLTDSTYGFNISESAISRPNETFNTDIFGLLLDANKLALHREQDTALIKPLVRYMELRHKFLEQI